MELLVDPEELPETHMTISHICAFIGACTTAFYHLRWNRLEETVRAVERRKARHWSLKDIDVGRARDLTVIFRKLRSYFPHNYLCLYDSLALIEFLARYRISTTWVFGIRLEPWAAHCWLQDGRYVVNEGIEEAASYTPVMAV